MKYCPAPQTIATRIKRVIPQLETIRSETKSATKLIIVSIIRAKITVATIRKKVLLLTLEKANALRSCHLAPAGLMSDFSFLVVLSI
jgi:hypothetical protein